MLHPRRDLPLVMSITISSLGLQWNCPFVLTEMFGAWTSFYDICSCDKVIKILCFAGFITTAADSWKARHSLIT